jgi:large subunit ribosomal protein L3
MFHRAPGGIGGSSFPSRVWKNQHFPGPHGKRKVTAKNLKVIKVDTRRKLLLVRDRFPAQRAIHFHPQGAQGEVSGFRFVLQALS